MLFLQVRMRLLSLHTAYSKSVFAKGAIEAAKFLAGKSAGMYDMGDVIAAR